jgi:hypothetical protein
MVDSFVESYEQLMDAKEAIERTFKDIEVLYKNFDPYYLDSWASTLRGASNIIEYDMGGALSAWGAADFVSPAATFIFDLDSIRNFDYRHKKNKEFIREYYYSSEIDTLRKQCAGVLLSYQANTIESIQAEIDKLQVQAAGADNAERLHLEVKIKALNDKKELYASGIYGMVLDGFLLNHEDTLINFVKNMVVYNLTSIQYAETRVRDFEMAADYLVLQFYDLKGGKATVQEKRTEETVPVKVENSEVTIMNLDTLGKIVNLDTTDDHPDRGKALVSGATPVRSDTATNDKKRVPSYHDIAHLQNGVDFVLLQQEMLLRDIAMVKARSAVVITALEAYTHHFSEMNELEEANATLEIMGEGGE